MKIKCSTLFDITKTDISNRRHGLDEPDQILFSKRRNQQRNFETVLQVISMRSQPEDISNPEKENMKIFGNTNWGDNFNAIKSPIPIWVFTFTVQHSSVFNDGITELGNLLSDCENVPMIVSLEEVANLNNTLSIAGPSKNIIFEIDNN